MARVKPGDKVVLNTPDNLTLHGAAATVQELTEWGAHVKTPAAATGNFRALWEEMIIPGTNGRNVERARVPGAGQVDSVSHATAKAYPDDTELTAAPENDSDGDKYRSPVDHSTRRRPATTEYTQNTVQVADGSCAPAQVGPTSRDSSKVDSASHTTARPDYAGDSCDVCGGMRLRRTGACLTCEDCGTNSGCG